LSANLEDGIIAGMNLFITFIARYLVFAIGLIFIVAILLSARTVRIDMIKLTALAFALAFLTAFLLGQLYYSDPPFVIEDIEPLITHQPDNSFPSHHTLVSMVATGVVFIYRRILGLLLLVMGLLVGAARVMAYLHYPLDIVASILIAVVAVFCAWLLLKKVDRTFRHYY
jgi:undecaprenyl-diphosphatase